MFRRRRDPAPPPRPSTDWRTFDSVAETYERYRAPHHEDPARDLVGLVVPSAGGRVLDVGTGTGVAALAATEATEGLVVGVDRSVEMLRHARARGLTAAAADVIDLPFRDGAFDAVLASFVIPFFRSYKTALFDMLRVLRPGGRLGVSTWGPGEDEFRRAWREVAEASVGKDLLRDALHRAAPWEERFSDAARLEEALRDAGMRPVRVHRRRYRFTHSIDEYLAGRDTSVPGRFVRHMLGDALWPRFRSRVEETFRGRFTDPIGDTVDVLLAEGTKPAR